MERQQTPPLMPDGSPLERDLLMTAATPQPEDRLSRIEAILLEMATSESTKKCGKR